MTVALSMYFVGAVVSVIVVHGIQVENASERCELTVDLIGPVIKRKVLC